MKCPVCDHGNIGNSVSLGTTAVLRCLNCSSEFLENYQQSRNHLYSQSYYDSWNLNVKEMSDATERIKHLSFLNLLHDFEKSGGELKGKRFLDIGCATGYMLDVARDKGCEVYGVELSEWACNQARMRHENIFNKTLEECSFQTGLFDVIAMTDVLEHISSPHTFLPEIKRILKQGGYILITSPDNSSWSRRLLGSKWFQFKDEHLIYYNKKALSYISNLYGFELLEIKTNWKIMCISYLNTQFKSYRIPVISDFLAIINRILPINLRRLPFKVPLSGEFFAILRK